jgi:shikimate kinase
MQKRNQKDIFLAGPKHSGKTSTGKALAALCGCAFFDLDELIAEQTGKTPRALYHEGANIFRKAEAEALAALVEAAPDGKGRVIAAGGGLIDNPEALELLQNNNFIFICLEVSAETAWRRILANSRGELPPFLQTENPRETHNALHKRRSAAYRQFSQIIIKAEKKNAEQIAEEIWVLLKNHEY